MRTTASLEQASPRTRRRVGALVTICAAVVTSMAGCKSVATVANPSNGATVPIAASTAVPEVSTTEVTEQATALHQDVPVAATDAAGIAAQIIEVESGLTDPATSDAEIVRLAKLQQVTYRKLSVNEAWDEAVASSVPPEHQDAVRRQVDARRQLLTLSNRPRPDTVPAWMVVEPAPASELLGYYQEAEGVFGVDWEILAAINLVETGMGRIRGLSVAGAQGPMQFIPGTWDIFGDGDVNSYRDSIMAAARMLDHYNVQTDPMGALYRYNNHDNYGVAVQHYAELMRVNERYFTSFYNWEIYYLSAFGDILLPVGYEQNERSPADAYIAANPQANQTCEAPRVACK